LPLAGTNKIDRKALAERAQRDVVQQHGTCLGMPPLPSPAGRGG
jgi:hypothetical protein